MFLTQVLNLVTISLSEYLSVYGHIFLCQDIDSYFRIEFRPYSFLFHISIFTGRPFCLYTKSGFPRQFLIVVFNHHSREILVTIYYLRMTVGSFYYGWVRLIKEGRYING